MPTPTTSRPRPPGAMARASAEGDRVVVVYATNGDHGDAPEDLADGETVVHRRRVEAEASAQATGTQQIVWLGYADSGMSGWDQNDAEGALHGADVDVVAKQLAAVLDEEDADVLVGYDWHGNYGHPDHVKVHHVAHRAAELAARRPRLLESTMNRTRMVGRPTGPPRPRREGRLGPRARRWTTGTRSARPRRRSPGRWTCPPTSSSGAPPSARMRARATPPGCGPCPTTSLRPCSAPSTTSSPDGPSRSRRAGPSARRTVRPDRRRRSRTRLPEAVGAVA